jgi:hypothetical protein
VPAEAVARFLGILTMEGRLLREEAARSELAENRPPSITLEQVDYVQVLEDKDEAPARQHDDIWQSIVTPSLRDRNVRRTIAAATARHRR